MKPSGMLVTFLMVSGLSILGLVLLAGAALRETPLFWRNEGGYPEALRALVLAGFFPAYVLYFLGLSGGSLAGWRQLRTDKLSGALLLLGCSLNWLLFAVTTTVVLWNNVQNLIEGRPFHYHAP